MTKEELEAIEQIFKLSSWLLFSADKAENDRKRMLEAIKKMP